MAPETKKKLKLPGIFKIFFKAANPRLDDQQENQSFESLGYYFPSKDEGLSRLSKKLLQDGWFFIFKENNQLSTAVTNNGKVTHVRITTSNGNFSVDSKTNQAFDNLPNLVSHYSMDFIKPGIKLQLPLCKSEPWEEPNTYSSISSDNMNDKVTSNHFTDSNIHNISSDLNPRYSNSSSGQHRGLLYESTSGNVDNSPTTTSNDNHYTNENSGQNGFPKLNKNNPSDGSGESSAPDSGIGSDASRPTVAKRSVRDHPDDVSEVNWSLECNHSIDNLPFPRRDQYQDRIPQRIMDYSPSMVRSVSQENIGSNSPTLSPASSMNSISSSCFSTTVSRRQHNRRCCCHCHGRGYQNPKNHYRGSPRRAYRERKDKNIRFPLGRSGVHKAHKIGFNPSNGDYQITEQSFFFSNTSVTSNSLPSLNDVEEDLHYCG